MIRARVTAQSSSRDDALTYLTNRITVGKREDWTGWEPLGDTTLTEVRATGQTVWRAAVTMGRE